MPNLVRKRTGSSLTWIYEDKPFTDEDVSEFIGFVYVIQNKVNGKSYIGKKLFFRSLSRKPLSGHSRRRRYRKQSDWPVYYGSNKQLNADVAKHGPDNFSRTILRLCKTKGECSYYETWHQIVAEVLRRPDSYYNEWIMCKVHRTHLKGA